MQLIQGCSREYGTCIGLCDLLHFLVVRIFKFGLEDSEYREDFVFYVRKKDLLKGV